MSRSLAVRSDYISQVKLAVQRNGYPRQKDLAEDIEFSLSTVNNFLNGKRIDNYYFTELCRVLALDWREIADFQDGDRNDTSNSSDRDAEVAIANPNDDNREIYIERPPLEKTCYEALLNPGALIRIKAPNWMGKTALMARMMNQVSLSQGYRPVYITLKLAEKKDLEDLDRLLKWFCLSVGQSLGLPNQLKDYWDEEFSSSKIDCTNYFERYLLSQSKDPVVLGLDEVETIFPYREIASEFLGLLRAWHEKAKTHKIWKNLRIILAHSTEVYIKLDVNSSPFNVGIPIQLTGFSLTQVQELAKIHKIQEQDFSILIDSLGGHPYLIKHTCDYLKQNPDISLNKILKIAGTDEGIYRDYLRHLWKKIQQDSDLKNALRKVIFSSTPVNLESRQAYRLHSMGFVDFLENKVVLRCELYRQYFSEKIGADR